MPNLTQSDSRISKGQVIVVATGFLCLFSLVGIMFYGLPFFYDFWVKEFGWSRATVTSGNAAGKIIVGLVGFFAGWIIDKSGPRRLMMCGIVLAGFSLIGLSRMTGAWQFYLCYTFSALGYTFAGPLPNQVLISRWFDRARGKAMGITYLGIGFGGMASPFIAKWLYMQAGWRDALMILGILMLVISLPMTFFLKESPVAPLTSKPLPHESFVLKDIIRQRTFFLLVIGSVCSIASVSGTIQNLKLFFSLDLKYSQSQSAGLLSFILFSSLIGRLFVGWLADRMNKKKVMMLMSLLVACSLPLLHFTNTPYVTQVFAFLFGICLGGDYMIIPLMAADLFGVRSMGRVMGLILTADGFSDAFSPILIGWIRDRTGSYMNSFSVSIIFALLCIVALWLMPRKNKEFHAVTPAVSE